MTTPRIEILSIGSELIEGRTTDTNSAEIATALAEAGFSVAAVHAVGDDLSEITALLRNVMDRADVCICTGGLGPTLDDLTRQAVAAACGKQLRFDEPAMNAIRDFFARSGRKMPQSNRAQAMFPQGATVMPNPVGTAPGFALECGGRLLACMPGVPREMRAMLRDSLLVLLQNRFPAPRCIKIKTLRLFGIPESALADLLGDLMARGRNPSVGTNASSGIIGIVIHSEGENPPDVEQKLLETENKIRNLVGEYIYGEGTMKLEEAVARLLEQYNITISTAESCTGGMLGSMLTNVPGISRFYREGIISYSNEAKVALADVPKALIAAKGAVSDEVARALAEGVRKKAEADLSVAITGIAGPTGGTQEKPVGLVYIAVTDRNMTESREFRFSGDRHTIRERASLTALNMLRLHILENMPPAPPHV